MPSPLQADLPWQRRRRYEPETRQTTTSSVSAKQKPNKWKVAKLIVKPKYQGQVAKMATQPNKKLLTVRQLIHSTRFKHGAAQSVFHIYRVRTAS